MKKEHCVEKNGDWQRRFRERERVWVRRNKAVPVPVFRSGNRAGFTYVEMAIVILIIMVLAAVALPRFIPSEGKYRLRPAAAKITALINSAHHISVAEHITCRIVCAAGENRCDLLCETPDRKENDAGPTDALRRSCEWKHGNPVKMLDSSTGEIAEADAKLIFFPDGSSEGPSLSLSNERGDTIIVEVFRAAALPYVYEQARK